MISIASLNLTVSDGSTVASTDIYNEGKTYINIGSGSVFTLEWYPPEFTNDDEFVDHYNLVIKRYDEAVNLYHDIFDKNVGIPLYTYLDKDGKEIKVNKFYVTSSILPVAPLQYRLSIYVIAYGNKGGIITSNIVSPYISKGAGAYVKAQSDLMKRAIAFVNAPISTNDTFVLVDRDRVPLAAADTSKIPLEVKAARVLTPNNSWNIVQDIYIRNNDAWQDNDIKYEVLLALSNNGQYEPVTDSNGELIYIL